MRQSDRIISQLSLLACLLAAPAGAMDGYFSNGYGPQCKALAGACTAVFQGTMAPASNPAAMFWAGRRYEVSLDIFNPNRSYRVTGSPSGYPSAFGMATGENKSGSNLFFVPDFGANWQVKENSTFGFAFYTNGGLNTNYSGNVYGGRPAGIDLKQMFLTPTWAQRVGRHHTFGATLILAGQTFQAHGLQTLEAFSRYPDKMTDNGRDLSFGAGARVGYLGQLTKRLSLGASYQTKLRMSAFGKYAGLFSEQGHFDIPALYNLGLAIRLFDHVTLSLDGERILFGGVVSMHNPMLPNMKTAKFGDNNGPGFGTRDMAVGRVGLQWERNRNWTYRAGYSHGQSPIPSSEVLFNLMSPGVLRKHAALGLTRRLEHGQAIHLALVRALPASVTGFNPLEVPGRQRIQLRMDQWELQMGFSFGAR
jgi:long-chain fatty acid transport protein